MSKDSSKSLPHAGEEVRFLLGKSSIGRVLVAQTNKGMVANRKVYPEVPPKVEYMLTKDGVALRPALRALKSWAASRKTGSSDRKE